MAAAAVGADAGYRLTGPLDSRIGSDIIAGAATETPEMLERKCP